MRQNLSEKNHAYWTDRADSYSQFNRRELEGPQNANWSSVLEEGITAHFPGRARDSIKVIDIGSGPGFFSILLAKLGYQVTGVDYTEAMLDEARSNAAELAGRIDFIHMNAEELSFRDGTFDVAVSRNLTWDLPDPEKAYRSWARVLKDGGLLLNFDANWYTHLYDEEARRAYEADRSSVLESGAEDHYTCTDIDTMEAIARRMPLSRITRPGWDRDTLAKIGMRSVDIHENIGDIVWSEEEKINYKATPMFMIAAVK